MSASAGTRMKVMIVGGGMITHDQLLPSLYHLERRGAIGPIAVCALSSGPLRTLAAAPQFGEAFPGQSFRPLPALDEPPEKMFPELYKEAVAALPPRQLVVVAVPDQFHFPVIKAALECDQHVLTVKPLVLHYAEAVEIERLARDKGLLVGVEYHKRFDRRSLDARGQYRRGRFGRIRLRRGEARRAVLLPPLELSKLVCQGEQRPLHVHRLPLRGPGLLHHRAAPRRGRGPRRRRQVPQRERRLPLVGRTGCLGERGGPQRGQRPGLSGRGAGDERSRIVHVLRGTELRRPPPPRRPVPRRQPRLCRSPVGAAFRFVSPDYFRLVPWEGEGLRPVGYGYDSVEAIVEAANAVNAAAAGLGDAAALAARRRVLEEIDRRGILATPANSSVNELVVEAARMSIGESGRHVVIDYHPAPAVRWR